MSTTSSPVDARPRISAAVAPHRHRALAGGQRLRAEGAAQVFGEGLVDGLADDAADVVGLEDGRMDVHEAGLPGVRAAAL
jgi:hypothetical protein